MARNYGSIPVYPYAASANVIPEGDGEFSLPISIDWGLYPTPNNAVGVRIPVEDILASFTDPALAGRKFNSVYIDNTNVPFVVELYFPDGRVAVQCAANAVATYRIGSPGFVALYSPVFSYASPTPGVVVTNIVLSSAKVEAFQTVSSTVVTSFNSRIGDVVLSTADIVGAGGAVAANPTFTGTITPGSGGIKGVSDGSNAAAGSVGEFLTNGQGAAIGVANNTWTALATITLTPGDWDVWGEGLCATAPNNLQAFNAAISTSSTGATVTNGVAAINGSSAIFTAGSTVLTPVVRMNVTVNTQVWLTVNIFTGVGSPTFTGWISARRVR